MNPKQRATAERLVADQSSSNLEWSRQVVALLRELAAEPVQEPVAWGVFVDDELFKPFNCKDNAVDWFQAQYNHGSRYDYLVLPLYAAPQQPMRCPTDGGECGAGGYCRPEPQQRKPLSDEQVRQIVVDASTSWAFKRDGSTSMRIARAIERAHGIGEPT